MNCKISLKFSSHIKSLLLAREDAVLHNELRRFGPSIREVLNEYITTSGNNEQMTRSYCIKLQDYLIIAFPLLLYETERLTIQESNVLDQGDVLLLLRLFCKLPTLLEISALDLLSKRKNGLYTGTSLNGKNIAESEKQIQAELDQIHETSAHFLMWIDHQLKIARYANQSQ